MQRKAIIYQRNRIAWADPAVVQKEVTQRDSCQQNAARQLHCWAV